MQNYIKASIMLLLLNLGISTLSMQKEDLQTRASEQTFESSNLIGDLPNEIWTIILEFIYFDPSVLVESKDIHEGLADLRTNLSLCSKNLRLTCKTFNLINQGFQALKKELKQFYNAILKENFLKLRDGGLHPIKSEWGLDKETNSKVAEFMLVGAKKISESILGCLANIIRGEKDEPYRFLRNKIVDLLLFYDADVNHHRRSGFTPLNFALLIHGSYYNNKDIIVALLAHGADVNLQNGDGNTALTFAVCYHNN